MIATTESVPLYFADASKPPVIPSWARHWNAHPASMTDVLSVAPLSGVFVVNVKNPAELAKCSLPYPAHRSKVPLKNKPAQWVIQWGEPGAISVDEMAQALKLFPHPVSRVDLTGQKTHLKERVMEAMAKYAVEQEEEAFPDALGEAKEVIEATGPLLAPSGRLSAYAIAELFGLKKARMAQLLDRSPQALAKTPDAPAIQDGLRPYERAARLRAVFKDDQFRAWIQRKNHHLDDHSPMDLIETGRVATVADLVESMLTGTPS